MLQYFCQVEHLFNVPSTAFTPQPKVSSAIVRLTPHQHKPLVADDVKTLETIVRNAFNQRRKTLKNSLKDITSEAALEDLGIDLSLRPENLSLAEYVVISNAVTAANPN
jgi:16S rRNA (adenine1518-N6/adenine1519-N6)-dimethyltransferase